MRVALVALGNPLRGDDGAAHRALELLGTIPGAKVLDLIQLGPEVADEIADSDLAVFIDADIEAGEARLTPVGPVPPSPSPLAHALRPEEVVALSRQLFGFQGSAWLCRIPAQEFNAGEGLTPACEANARRAAQLLRRLLAGSAEPNPER